MPDYDFIMIDGGAAAFAAAAKANELVLTTVKVNDGLPVMADNADAVASCLSLIEEAS